MSKTHHIFTVFQVFTNLTILNTPANTRNWIPNINLLAHNVLLDFFTHTDTDRCSIVASSYISYHEIHIFTVS